MSTSVVPPFRVIISVVVVATFVTLAWFVKPDVLYDDQGRLKTVGGVGSWLGIVVIAVSIATFFTMCMLDMIKQK